MIIKRINIIAFGGLNNKVLELSEGANIIYGENEAGKSTIQAFIKIWLYGFASYRGKDYRSNERLKYSPINGEKISGELYIQYKNKDYIIKRTFGKIKKDDFCIVIDSITGKEVEDIEFNEPGKSILGVNRNTFINTLFIGQLAVNVKKDKDEEILDKISNLINDDVGQVSIDKSLAKLEGYKKRISNNRKNGEYDLLIKKHSDLIKERYEAYELSEHNLENEKKLINSKEKRKKLNKELVSLDSYKKYLKKIKIKSEYEEINNYFIKKQELKKQEDLITESLKFNDKIIDKKSLSIIKEKYYDYLNLLDITKKRKEEINLKEEKFKKSKENLSEYKYIEEFEDDIIIRLEKLKIQQEVLKEKVNIKKNIDSEINYLENKESEAKKLVGNAYKIKEFKEEIEDTLTEYKNSLILLKNTIENNKNSQRNKIFKVSLILTSILSVVLGVVIKNLAFSLILYFIGISIVIFYIINFYILNNQNKNINKLKNSISNLEKHLEYYIDKVNVGSYEELLRNFKIYDDYLKLGEKISNKILENIRQKELLELDKALISYKENKVEIGGYLNKFKANNLDELIDKINNYKKLEKIFIIEEIENKNLRVELQDKLRDLNLKESEISEELNLIKINDFDINRIKSLINDLEEKIDLKDEINKKILSVEETYLALTKNKDIQLIKGELVEEINNNFNYSYKSEEEIDEILKDKNKKLVNVEKEIKDIENEINNRFIGKRSIPEVEEEVEDTYKKINELEKELKASNIASTVLRESYDEIRNGFGELLNEKVIKSFKKFTDEKYNKVMVADNYGMMVSGKSNIIKAELLSNGANDQLYLSLRLAFIEMIFDIKDIAIYLDDTFVQYDDKRLKIILKYLTELNFKQILIFTCHKREKKVFEKENIYYKYNELGK